MEIKMSDLPNKSHIFMQLNIQANFREFIKIEDLIIILGNSKTSAAK